MSFSPRTPEEWAMNDESNRRRLLLQQARLPLKGFVVLVNEVRSIGEFGLEAHVFLSGLSHVFPTRAAAEEELKKWQTCPPSWRRLSAKVVELP